MLIRKEQYHLWRNVENLQLLLKEENMRYIAALFFTIVFSGTVLAGQNAVYTVNGQQYEGYWQSAGTDTPLVIIIHDWDGLTDYEVKRTEMLVELGYSVFAADLFGAGVRPETIDDKRKLTGALYKDRAKMRALLEGAVTTAKEKGLNTENAVIAGYCFGGAAVLEFARAGADLKGFVTFHGGLVTPEGQDYSKTRGQILVFHGSADSAVTMEQFASLTQQLEEAKVTHEMTTYSGAPHAFTVFGSDRYREDADKKSWNRFTQFLTETF
jgi:dienelactone hydrolase